MSMSPRTHARTDRSAQMATRAGGSSHLTRRSFLVGSLALATLPLAARAPLALAQEAVGPKVVASFYPMYDFTRKVAGDRAQVSMLIPSGTEPHDWEPSTSDITEVAQADLLVYNGAGMESWVDDMLSSLDGGPVGVEASQGVVLRTLGEEDDHDGEDGGASSSSDEMGMADDHAEEHEHDEDGHEDDDHDHEGHNHEDEEEGHDHGEEGHHHHDHHGTDPHVWLSPRNARIEMENIRDALIQADPDGSEEYQANCDKWTKELDALDQEYTEALSAMTRHEIVVSHEAFGYLCDAYGLVQEPIEGIDADAEPDAKRMAEIADFVTQSQVKVIFTEELVSPKVAEAIAQETGARVEELSPLEGLSQEQIDAGEDYLSVMRSNLSKLVEALS